MPAQSQPSKQYSVLEIFTQIMGAELRVSEGLKLKC